MLVSCVSKSIVVDLANFGNFSFGSNTTCKIGYIVHHLNMHLRLYLSNCLLCWKLGHD